jgi:chromate transporter
MSLSLLARLAATFASLSVVSIGGVNALIPELRRQVVTTQGLMSDAAFIHTFAIATAAPGPNSILASLIGWRVAGLSGLLVATLAFALPSSLVAYAAARGLTRWADSAAVACLKAGLAPLALGLIVASGATMARLADRNLVEAAVTAGAAAFVIYSSRNPLWAVSAGALAMIAARHAAF